MELILSRDPLLKALGRIQSVVERRNTMPILANALIQADGETLIVTATDTEVSVRTECAAEVVVAGQLAVPARRLLDVTRELPDQPIRMKAESTDRLLITCGRSRFTLLCLPGEDFPKIPQPDEGPRLPIAAALFAKLLDKTHFAMSVDETRFTLNGVLLQVEPQGNQHILRLVATDTHRLAIAQIDLATDAPLVTNTHAVIIPRKGVAEIRSLLKEEDELVDIILGETFIQVIKPRFNLISKLVSGRYPNYKRAVPEGNEHLLTVQKTAFLGLLKRMVVISTEKSHSIQLQISTDNIKVTSNNPDQEVGEEELETVYAGPPMTIGFSARYLMEIMGAVEGDSVRFALGSQDLPVLVTDPDNENYMFVLMPMQ